MGKHAISFKNEQKIARDSFKQECDINRIVARYENGGAITHVAAIPPQYGEAPDISLFDAACVQATLRSAEEEGLFDLDEEAENAPAASQEASEAGSAEPTAEPAPQDAAPDESSG